MNTSAIKAFIRLCQSGAARGWHERNGGNLSYRMTKDDITPLPNTGEWIDIGIKAANLANEHFIVTGSGKYFGNVAENPPANIGVIEINDTGETYRVRWGLEHGARPTSELPTHLLNHSVKKALNDKYRVIYHAHTPSVIALTNVLPLEARIFSRVLWKSMTECPIVFPEGVGVVPWMVPGGRDIAVASAELMETFNVIVWAHHGIFAAGADFDETFGLIETVEKSADIYIKALSCGQGIKQTITDAELKSVADAFGVQLKEEFL